MKLKTALKTRVVTINDQDITIRELCVEDANRMGEEEKRHLPGTLLIALSVIEHDGSRTYPDIQIEELAAVPLSAMKSLCEEINDLNGFEKKEKDLATTNVTFTGSAKP